MYAITAIAVNRVTGEPDYFLVAGARTDEGHARRANGETASVVYKRMDFIEFVESVDEVVIVRDGAAPQPVCVRYGTHGYRYVEAVENGRATDALKRLPRFAFVNESTAADLTRLHQLAGTPPAQAAPIPDDALERYRRFGWVRHGAAGPELTTIGRALLACA